MRIGSSWTGAANLASFGIIAPSMGALYIIGVWESETHLRRRLDSKEFEGPLAEAGFPSFDTADVAILRLHAFEPPLKP